MTAMMYGMEDRLGDKFGKGLEVTNDNRDKLSTKVDNNDANMRAFVIEQTEESQQKTIQLVEHMIGDKLGSSSTSFQSGKRLRMDRS